MALSKENSQFGQYMPKYSNWIEIKVNKENNQYIDLFF